MENNFDLKKFLVESKLTTNSRMLNEDEQFLNDELSQKQKEQLEDLVFLTIIPAINDDLGIDNDALEQKALRYLVEIIQEGYIQ